VNFVVGWPQSVLCTALMLFHCFNNIQHGSLYIETLTNPIILLFMLKLLSQKNIFFLIL